MTKILHRIPEIRLVPIPQLAKGGRWRVEAMRSYTTDLLLWFTRGQGRITVGGVTRGYGPHNAIYIPAGTMHGFEVSSMVYGTAVHIPTETGLPFPTDPLHLRVRDATSQAEITGHIDNLGREIDGSQPDRIRATHHHAGLLCVTLNRQLLLQSQEKLCNSKASQIAFRFAALIEKNFRSGRSLSCYARELGVTPTHLTRVCKSVSGRSASALLTDRVIYEARLMLTETKRPVCEIAAELGFGSPAYFTRAFSHHTGMTPTAFRNQG